MTNFAKLHILSECYYDSDETKQDSRSQREKHHMLESPPKFWDFVHYFLFCGVSYTGPIYDYRNFFAFINLKETYANMPKNTHIWPALCRFAHGLVCLVANLVLSLCISEKYILDEEFAKHNIIFKVAYLIASMHLIISTMFTAFCFMEACLIASGQGYRPKSDTQDETFNAIRSVDIYKFETVVTMSDAVAYWNSASQNWLKYYVMLRIIDRK